MPEIWGNAFETYNKGEIENFREYIAEFDKNHQKFKIIENFSLQVIKICKFLSRRRTNNKEYCVRTKV